MADAEVRVASPTGGNSGTCTTSEPVCSLQHAVSVATPGDQVAMLPGDYTETTPVTINAAIGVGGISGQPRPRIVSTATSAVEVTADNASVHDLRIEDSNAVGVRSTSRRRRRLSA